MPHYYYIGTSWDQYPCLPNESLKEKIDTLLEDTTLGYKISWGRVFQTTEILTDLEHKEISISNVKMTIVKACLVFARKTAQSTKSKPAIILSLLVKTKNEEKQLNSDDKNGHREQLLAESLKEQLTSIANPEWRLAELTHSEGFPSWAHRKLPVSSNDPYLNQNEQNDAILPKNIPLHWLLSYVMAHHGKLTCWRINRYIGYIDPQENKNDYRRSARAQNDIRLQLINLKRFNLTANISNSRAWKVAHRLARQSFNLKSETERLMAISELLDRHIDRVENLRADIERTATSHTLLLLTLLGLPLSMITVGFTLKSDAEIVKKGLDLIVDASILEILIFLGVIPFLFLVLIYAFQKHFMLQETTDYK